MLGEKHDLSHEFPEFRERIRDLKDTDPQFAVLAGEYHDLDHYIRRIEAGLEHHSDEFLEDLKKKRLLLKDQLYGMLKGDYPPQAASSGI